MGKGSHTPKTSKPARPSKNPSVRNSAIGDVTVGNNIDDATTDDRPSSLTNFLTSKSDGEEGNNIDTEGDTDNPSLPQSGRHSGGADESNNPEIVTQSIDPKHPKRKSRGRGRFIFKNLWEICCNETETETKEVSAILNKIGLPSVTYTKRKSYELTDYDSAPDVTTCKSKYFLDFYVFSFLLPAIQPLIQFARVNRVFQCRFCAFNAIDFLVEYLYNNNPRYPERALNPTPIYEIPFCRNWLENHPRTPPPNWMLMSSEEAAVIIQRVVRGYMVRCRPEVQEMRQFWRDYRKDLAQERAIYKLDRKISIETVKLAETHTLELGEFSDSPPPQSEAPPPISNHSDNCIYCEAFRNFLAAQPDDILKSYERKAASVEAAATADASEAEEASTADRQRSSVRKETVGISESPGTAGTEPVGDIPADQNMNKGTENQNGAATGAEPAPATPPPAPHKKGKGKRASKNQQ